MTVKKPPAPRKAAPAKATPAKAARSAASVRSNQKKPAATRANLRAVKPGEKPPATSTTRRAPRKRTPATILQAAESGSRLDELKAMRRRIAKALDDFGTPARDLAALSRRQLEISREIEAIETTTEGDDIGRAVDSPDEGWDSEAI